MTPAILYTDGARILVMSNEHFGRYYVIGFSGAPIKGEIGKTLDVAVPSMLKVYTGRFTLTNNNLDNIYVVQSKKDTNRIKVIMFGSNGAGVVVESDKPERVGEYSKSFVSAISAEVWQPVTFEQGVAPIAERVKSVIQSPTVKQPKIVYPLFARTKMNYVAAGRADPNICKMTVMFSKEGDGTVIQTDAYSRALSEQVGYHSNAWKDIEEWEICEPGTTISITLE
ncbi:hypothetical protein Acj9p073 [Acinetobacter phage Acj9]|uniref:Uncharacterized protein n=1 Tax=Acinetobacter phage Acj9 TaxID=760939 RepID=E5EPK7_9CAUD|nr:hypothetical protein Acj9p073 [Acinetobacter phage Acj9]ADG59973.1 hypothetical protein Acj9p073 [Acinetobacter phage Acj9]